MVMSSGKHRRPKNDPPSLCSRRDDWQVSPVVSEKSIVLSWLFLKWVCAVQPIWRCIGFGFKIKFPVVSENTIVVGQNSGHLWLL